MCAKTVLQQDIWNENEPAMVQNWQMSLITMLMKIKIPIATCMYWYYMRGSRIFSGGGSGESGCEDNLFCFIEGKGYQCIFPVDFLSPDPSRFAHELWSCKFTQCCTG